MNRPTSKPGLNKKVRGPAAQAEKTVTFRAGCGRTWEIKSREPDLAYTEQAFAECPTCPNRVEPDGATVKHGPPFCTLRPVGTAHPFAALAGLIPND